MRRRTPAARRGIAALAASFAAVLLGVLLAPTAATAAPVNNLGASSVYWTAQDESGRPVDGVTFRVVADQGGNATATQPFGDCAQAPCTGGDRNPARGEFQATGYSNGNNWVLRVTVDSYPAGYEPLGTTSQDATFSKNTGEVVRLAEPFVFRVPAPVVHPSASCVAGTYYSMLENGAVRQIVGNVNTAFGTGWTGRSGANALGIGTGGTTMFALERSGGTVNSILRYTTSGGYQTAWTGSYATASSSVIAGAVSPSTGAYLFGGFASSGGNLVFDLHRFDPSSSSRARVGTVATGLSATALPPSGANGDLAFDRAGNLIVIYSDSSQLRAFRVPAATLSSTDAQLQSEALPIPSDASVLSSFNGIAYAADGTLALSNSSTLRTYDPLSFATVGADVTNLNQGAQSTDLASCGPPPSLTLRKVVDGRASAADQFRLDIVGGSGVRSATTTGSTNGLQAASVTDVTVRSGQTYTVRELMADGSAISASAYGTALSCTAGALAGSGASQTITMPTNPTAVVCTFTNTPLVTTVTVRKDVQDVDGANQAPRQGWTVGAVATATAGTLTQAPAASGGSSQQATLANGTASWSVGHGSASSVASIAISEVQQPGYAFVGATCTVTSRTGSVSAPVTFSTISNGAIGTLTSVGAGSTVDCRIVNRELPTTLTLVNEAHGGKPAAEWTLAAAGPSGSLAGPNGATGTPAASTRVTPGVAYALTASGSPATYVAEGPWSCVDGARAVVPVTASGSVTLQRGSSVTCRIVHSTARLVLLQQVEGAGGLEAADFRVTASPASGAPALVATTRTGTDAVGAASTIEVRPGRAYELSSTSDAIHIPLRLEQHDGTLLPDGSLDPEHWTTATVTTATVDARGIAYYRFVALSPLPFVLPITGGIGADAYQLGGLGLLVLAIGALVVRALRRRLPMTRTTIPNTPAPQEGTATMATITKSRAARIAAGAGALALASLVALGGAAPASAADDNIDATEPRSLTIHKFAEPETATGLSNDGTEITDPAAFDGLTALEGVTFSIQRVGDIDLTTPEGWTAADGLTPAAATSLGLGTAVVGKTDGAGTVEFTGLAAAVYLVTETDHGANDIAFQADPFLVTVPMPADNEWIYDVHVYPKNSVTGIDKTFADGLLEGVGDRATWTIRADVPEVAAGKSLPSFVISDTLDPRLTYLDATVTANNLSLDDADYVLDVSGQTVTVTVTNLAKLAAADNASIEVEIVTTVSSLAAPTAGDEDGVISNDATLTIDGTDFTSGPVKTEWATLAILAHELRDPATDRSGVLAGAEFQIFASKADYDARTNPISVGGRSTFESGDNGVALVGTLPAGQYWILETKAPAGYQVRESIAPVTLVGGEISTTEIDAYVPHAQVPAYALPVTGGDGQLMFMLGGAGLVLLAVGFALVRRRKAEQQA